MLGSKALLRITGVEALIAIASLGLTLVELVESNLVEDSKMREKVYKYAAKFAHIKELIDKMYVFIEKELHDKILDKKNIAMGLTVYKYTKARSSYNNRNIRLCFKV